MVHRLGKQSGAPFTQTPWYIVYENRHLSNVKGKPQLYCLLAAVKDQACVVRDPETANQLASIEASKLRAPAGLHDDRADAFAPAVAGLVWRGAAVASSVVAAGDPLAKGVGW